MQEHILERHPAAELQVYAVWLPMLATDERSSWEPSLLADPRVAHFWDGERVAGSWFAKANLGGLGYAGIVWDAYFVFGRDAVWRDAPRPLRGSGSTVIGTTDDLQNEIAPLLAR